MLTDAGNWNDPGRLQADVVVVGAGPAGLTVALELAAAGRSVVVLESGGRGREIRAQELASGESVGDSYFPIGASRVRGFAGTSLHWEDNGWFRARPLDPIDLGARPEIDRVGWPVGRDELDPWYERAQELCRLGPFDYRPETWEASGRERLALDPDVVQTSMFQLTPYTTWRERYDEVVGHPGIHLVLHATVPTLPVDPGGRRVTPLVARTDAGVDVTVEGRHYVLAAGGMENARLLLLSGRPGGHGLGNDHDVVGRFFMEHLAVRAGRWRVDPGEVGLYLPHPVEEGLRVQGKLALAPEVLRSERLLNGTFFLIPMTEHRAHAAVRSFVTLRRSRTWRPRPPDLGAHLGQVVRHPGVIARTALDEVRRRHREDASLIQLMAMTEQEPNPRSRITLGTTRDRLGQPRLRLEWRRTERDRASVRRAHERLDAAFKAAGLPPLEDKLGDEGVRPQVQPQWHHMGTTRMDPDPTRGVVDEHLRLHGVENLHVVGSSVFPTGGYANPTLTLVALAARLSARLHDLLG